MSDTVEGMGPVAWRYISPAPGAKWTVQKNYPKDIATWPGYRVEALYHASALEALVVERDEALAQRDAYRDERDSLTTIVSSEIDDVAGAELDDLESRALAVEAQRDKLRAELLAALKAIRNAARKNRVDPDAIYEIANGAIRDAARSTLDEIAP